MQYKDLILNAFFLLECEAGQQYPAVEKAAASAIPHHKGISEAQHQHNWKNEFSPGFATAGLIPAIPIIT